MEDTPQPPPPVPTADDPLPPVNELVVLAGGVEEPVLRRDGSRETVKIRMVGLGEMGRFGDASRDGSGEALAELACARPAGWAAGLTVPSLERIVIVTGHLNGERYFRWADRQVRILDGQRPLLEKGLALAKQLPPSVLAGLIGPTT